MRIKKKYLIQSILKNKYLIRSLCLAILLIATGEIFARYYLGLGTPPLSMSHPSIEYMFKPNQDVYRYGHHVIVNQYGMRSEPFAKKKGSNEMRVMVFGDSVVNGGSPTDQADIATSILKEQLTKIVNKNVVVGNISAGSWGPGNWLAYAKEYGFFDPDIVVLVISSHDYADNPTFEPLNKYTHPTENPASALIEGIEKYWNDYISSMYSGKSVVEVTQLSTDKNDNSDDKKAATKGLGDLKSFLELAKSNSRTVLVFQHYRKPEIESGRADPGNQEIKATCEQLGIKQTSLEPYFRKSIQSGVDPYRDLIHPNQVGQKAIADAILAEITNIINK
jgi:lysophospholipase L1-like esterase